MEGYNGLRFTSLKDNPEFKEEINRVLDRLNDLVLNSDRRHLADVGVILSFISKDTSALCKKALKLHNEQKLSNPKQQ